MGGCYSAESHKALTSPRHKQPKSKNGAVHHNGKSPDSAAVAAGNREARRETVSEEPCTKATVSAEEVEPFLTSSEKDQVKGVAPSDSGIESIGSPQEETAQEPVIPELSLCQSCHQRLQRISRGSCHQCGNFRINSSELSTLASGDTYCTCGPRVLGKQAVCRTHKAKSGHVPSHRHSDILGMVLKSNLKKQGSGREGGKRVRMSWKSADSLDMGANMNTCMDRAKSEASEIFGDDVSFRAPLAQFDSVDCQLDAEEGGSGDGEFLSRMSIYSEILDLADCICKCDFSNSQAESPTTDTAKLLPEGKCETENIQAASTCGLTTSPMRSPPLRAGMSQELEEDEDSGRGVSKSEEHSESVCDSDLDTGEESDRLLSCQSTPSRQGGVSWFDGSFDWTEMVEGGVCPITVKGRKMVMMDAGTYSQMLSDLALLKEQLSHLTQVIQEEDSVPPLDLSLPMH